MGQNEAGGVQRRKPRGEWESRICKFKQTNGPLGQNSGPNEGGKN